MKRVFLATLLSLLVVSVGFADAPETGNVQGKVTDASGTELPGVTITLEGPRGSQAAISQEGGAYRFALLPPGEYTVKAELEGFQATQVKTSVTAGRTTEVNLKLTLGTSEEITVTSEAPMVDKFNVTAGSTVTSEVGQEVAGSTRTYYGVINTLPGVASDGDNEDIQQARPNVNGTSWSDQQVFIDGVDTSFARFGGSRVLLPTTAVTEVTMEAGGSSAEYGRAIGSTTNVIVKSGTNRYHGDGAITYQDVSLDADYKTQPVLANRESNPADPNSLKRTELEKGNTNATYELSIGGPIKRDKAWFFLGWSTTDSSNWDQTLNRDPVDVSLDTEAYIAKFNLQPGASHQVSVSYMDTPANRNYFIPQTFDYWVPTPHVIDGTLATLNWSWSISSNLFLETKIADQTSDENKFLACGSPDLEVCLAQKQQDRGPDGQGELRFPANPAYDIHYPGNNYNMYATGADGSWHNGWDLDNGFGLNAFPRQQANASLTQFVGANHELKYGIDWQDVAWNSNVRVNNEYGSNNADFDALNPWGFEGNGGISGDCGVARTDPDLIPLFQAIFGPTVQQAGGCSYTDRNPPDLVADLGTQDSSNEDLALYVRDRFTVGDHFTFNLGLRVEQAVARNDTNRKVVDSTNWAPRLSASYDVKGDGRMLFSVNAGRYFAQLNQQWINEHLMDQWNGYQGFDSYLFCDPIDVALTTAIFPGALPGCEKGVGYNYVFQFQRPGQYWDLVDAGVLNNDIKPYHKDEIILGFEWQFSNNWVLDSKAIFWELGNQIGASTQANPFGGQFKMVGNYDDYPGMFRQLDAARVAQGRDPLFEGTNLLDNFQTAKSDYQALQVQVNRRFKNGWALFNNVTFAEAKTTGGGAWWNNTNDDYAEDLHVTLNEAQLAQCQNRQPERTVPVNCYDLESQLGTSVSTQNRYGPSELTDRPIILNSFGFKSWALGRHNLTAGGHFSYVSGMPWFRTEGVAGQVFDLETGEAPQNGGVTLYVEERGTRRLDDTWNMNLSLAWEFPIAREITGTLRGEALNVPNNQDQVNINTIGEVRRARREFQQPTQYRFSLTFRF